MPVYWLDEYSTRFPNPNLAEDSGLVAIGGDLSPERLLSAYGLGIFPWYQSNAGDFYWFSPDPRCVLFPSKLKVHKSMRSIFNQNKFQYTLDTEFQKVMEACSKVARRGELGSWINQNFIDGYSVLHKAGFAHSVEVWDGAELIGGLYGVSIGKVFFGESMFASRPNASKAGFIQLVRALEKTGFDLIDCQQKTRHLTSLGAEMITRETFSDRLKLNAFNRTLRGKWCFTEDGTISTQLDSQQEKQP